MKSWECQLRPGTRSSTAGAARATCTSVSRIAAARIGAAECITMHRGQWSESLFTGCTCVTWATVNIARSARHTTATTAKARECARRF